jgi:hypothetical protein
VVPLNLIEELPSNDESDIEKANGRTSIKKHEVTDYNLQTDDVLLS